MPPLVNKKSTNFIKKWPYLSGLALVFLASPSSASSPTVNGGPVVPAASTAVPSTISQLAGDSSLRSAEGAEFELLTVTSAAPVGATAPSPHRFLVEGGLHGNEEQTSQFVLWLARRYSRGESPLNELTRKHVMAIDFLPRANPDGDRELSRYNRRGVNLNRNFGVLWGISRENPGVASFSEPETRAIRALFTHRHYTAAVDVHGYINWVVAPSAPEALAAKGHSVSPTQKAAYKQWRDVLTEAMGHLSGGYQLKTGALLGDGGAFEDWAFWNQGTYAFCLEMETFQRFVPVYTNPQNASSTTVGAKSTIDLYKRYELFIYQSFARAMELKDSTQAPETTLAKVLN